MNHRWRVLALALTTGCAPVTWIASGPQPPVPSAHEALRQCRAEVWTHAATEQTVLDPSWRALDERPVSLRAPTDRDAETVPPDAPPTLVGCMRDAGWIPQDDAPPPPDDLTL